MGPDADDGVPVSLDIMVLDTVLEPLVDITKMVPLMFFLEFLSRSLYSIVLFPLVCDLDLPPPRLSVAFKAAYLSVEALRTWGLDPRGRTTFPFRIYE